MTPRQARSASVALGVTSILTGLLLLPGLSIAAATTDFAAASNSAMTVAGQGPFSSLHVTVDQTTHLSNQVVTVSWTGGAPTFPAMNSYNANYLQVMQCWGDDPAGPPREQCEFGSVRVREGVSLGGPVFREVGPTDPLEKDAGTTTDQYLPFRMAGGRTVPGSQQELSAAFTSTETNEIPLTRTNPDGTGSVAFEMQTGLESSSLGCGLVYAGGTAPHKCWLVVVPRGDVDVDGRKVVGGGPENGLRSSPLSLSNWQNRLVVPLDFTPIVQQCAIGKDERPLSGNQTVLRAMSRWQGGFCQQGGANLSYVAQGDPQARLALSGTDPQLRVVSGLQRPETIEGTVYAPIALTGFTLASLVERQPSASAPNAHVGDLLPPVKLNQRLAAKLLTQSYSSLDPTAIVGNPRGPTFDPEFLALNPEYKDQNFGNPFVVSSSSDAVYQLWQWIVSDADARAFLAGKPDRWGTHINKHYIGETFPRFETPRADTLCAYPPGQPLKNQPPRCAFVEALAPDWATAARWVFRGDSQGRPVWDGSKVPGQYKKSPPQALGDRTLSGLMDVPSAERLQLVTAQLRTSAGTFVGPTPAAMAAAAAAMSPGAMPGTLVLDQAHVPANAYPLTAYEYAATTTGKLSATDAKTYADFVRYVVTNGQHLGDGPTDLPRGYVPLPPGEVAKAKAAANTIEANKAVATPPTPTPSTSADGGPTVPSPVPVTSGDVPATPPSGTPSAAPTASAATPAATPSATVAASASPLPSTVTPAGQAPPVLMVVARTPTQPMGADRYGAIAALILGGVALLLRGLLPWVGRLPVR